MSANKSSLSGGRSYEEIGAYWDDHDLGEAWDSTEPAEFEVDLKSVRHYYPVERALSDRVTRIAREQGVSPETLVNLWIQEKVGSSGS
ncbi:MAG TPA: CopG family antitoxin [Thermoanaerobaculia bacterium]|nr:CopG family antitoxin [Thermoanaerobaculia bacterium]